LPGTVLFLMRIMHPDETLLPPPQTNRHSIISLTLGILTLLALCGGIIPVPLTGFVCFPASSLLGLSALFYGIRSLMNIRKTNEAGRSMAWIGVFIGGVTFLCMLCILGLAVAGPMLVPDSFMEGF